jgi:hypothetical protein
MRKHKHHRENERCERHEEIERHLHPLKIHENTGRDLVINEHMVKKAHLNKLR